MTQTTTETLAALEAAYGDGYWEISKAMTQAERERTEARIGLATNIVGLTAGGAALVAAGRNKALRPGGAVMENAGPVAARVAPKLGSPNRRAALIRAGAIGALGLQGLNTVGDAVANRVLTRESKKPVKKSWDEAQDQPKAKLVRLASDKSKPAVKKAVDKTKEFTFQATGKVSKSLEDKRQVYGWVSVTELNGKPVVDRQNDYVTIEEIEKAAHEYLTSSRRGGDMHDKEKTVSTLIESFIVTPEKKELLGLPESTPTGWWCGFQIHDDDVWKLVKNGERPMLSIHGSGRRIQTEIDVPA